jgi:hypothetical protein
MYLMKRAIAVIAMLLAVTLTAGAVAKGGGNAPGFLTSQASMLTPLAPGATVKPLMTVGETLASGYRMESIPDGISLTTQGQDHVTVYLNHEASTVPFGGFGDITNAMVSRLTLAEDASVKSGAYVIPSSANYQRFCSNFLVGRAEGFNRDLLFTNEETPDFVNRTGTAWPPGPGAEQAGLAVAYDIRSDQYRSIYGMGRHNHENSVGLRGYGYPAVLSGDDTFSAPASQMYLYTAPNADAVWNDQGQLWAFQSDDPNVNDYSDLSGSTTASGSFIPVPPDIAKGGQDGLENWSNANNVFQFIRIEDIATDRNNSNVVYFADTGEPRALPGATPSDRMRRGPSGTKGPHPNGRVFKMVLDPSDPTKVTSLSILIEGDPNGAASAKDVRFIHNPDNVETTGNSLLILEDPGSQNFYAPNDPAGTTARVWRYDLATGDMTVVAKVDSSQDPAAKQGEWESSGIINASRVFGPGAFLIDVQAHTIFVDKTTVGTTTYKREGGQLLLLRIPGTYRATGGPGPKGPGPPHYTRSDGLTDLPRHALRLVSAARRQRARGGRCSEAARAWTFGHRPRFVEPRSRSRGRAASAPRRPRRGSGRPRPGRPDLAPQPDRRARRRARQPVARARTGTIRHRPRLRAGASLTFVPCLARRAGNDRCDLLECGKARLSARAGTARAPARAHRRARRDQRGDG